MISLLTVGNQSGAMCTGLIKWPYQVKAGRRQPPLIFLRVAHDLLLGLT